MKRLQIPQKLVYGNFTYTKKFYVHEIVAVILSKIYYLKNAKKTCQPNNWIKHFAIIFDIFEIAILCSWKNL